MGFLQGLGVLCDLLQAIIAGGTLLQRASSPEASRLERLLIASVLMIGVGVCGYLSYVALIQEPQQYQATRLAADMMQTQAFSGELGRVRTAVLKHRAEWEA